jgi:hypothetical protein
LDALDSAAFVLISCVIGITVILRWDMVMRTEPCATYVVTVLIVLGLLLLLRHTLSHLLTPPKLFSLDPVISSSTFSIGQS